MARHATGARSGRVRPRRWRGDVDLGNATDAEAAVRHRNDGRADLRARRHVASPDRGRGMLDAREARVAGRAGAGPAAALSEITLPGRGARRQNTAIVAHSHPEVE